MVTFHGTLQSNGKTATGIRVPDDVVAALGSSKRPAVRVTIAGYTYRSSVASMRGVFMLRPQPTCARTPASPQATSSTWTLELDTEPRVVSVPPDFAAALDRDAQARRFFDGLSYSNKQRFVLAIEGAKTDETRQRRIARSVEALRDLAGVSASSGDGSGWAQEPELATSRRAGPARPMLDHPAVLDADDVEHVDAHRDGRSARGP